MTNLHLLLFREQLRINGQSTGIPEINTQKIDLTYYYSLFNIFSYFTNHKIDELKH